MRKPGKPKKAKKSKSPSKTGKTAGKVLKSVFEQLKEILVRHAPPFRTDITCMSGGKPSFQLTVPNPVPVPGAYGGKPVDLQFAAAILQKDFVGFYLMCIYMNDSAKQQMSPALLKLLKGKSCFHLKALDNGLKRDIENALELGTKAYRERGWV